MATTLCHACKLTPDRDLLKATFSDIVDITEVTNALFFLTVLKSVGNSDFSGHTLIHEFFQNRTWDPSPRLPDDVVQNRSQSKAETK